MYSNELQPWKAAAPIKPIEAGISDSGQWTAFGQWTALLESRIGNHSQRLTECDSLQAVAAWKGMATNELYRLRYNHLFERFTSFESISWNASQRSTDWDVLQRIAVLEGSCSDKTNRGRNIDYCQWTATLESRIGNHSQRLTECDFLQTLAAWKGMATNELYGLRHGHTFQRLTVLLQRPRAQLLSRTRADWCVSSSGTRLNASS